MTSRRKTRELALSCCYEIEVGKQVVDEVLERVAEEQELETTARDFLNESIRKVFDHQKRVDKIIQELAIGWRIERIARVDLAILRLAIVELLIGLEDPPAPEAIVINEAVVLAKKFSTEDSGKFVNGILASVVKNKDKYREMLLSTEPDPVPEIIPDPVIDSDQIAP
jgi:transcription antitermination protein NusB